MNKVAFKNHIKHNIYILTVSPKFSAENFGLTVNMYMLCLIWFLNATLFIYVKNKLQTVI